MKKSSNTHAASLLCCSLGWGTLLAGCSSEPPRPPDLVAPQEETAPVGARETTPSNSDQSGNSPEREEGQPVAGSDQVLALHDQILAAAAGVEESEVQSAAFKVDGLRVGIEEKVLTSLPVVSFFAVEKADYYQLLRCDANSQIQGIFDTLENVELTTVNLQDEVQKHLENKFWMNALANDDCVVLSKALTRTVFHDSAAPNGSHRYLVRACAFDTNQTPLCSEVVSQSTVLASYENLMTSWNEYILGEVARLERQIEEESLQIAKLTHDFAAAIVRCERENKLRALSEKRKRLLAKILGVGAQIGGQLIINDYSTTMEAAQSLWGKKADLVADSRPLGAILQDLFVTEKEAQLSCYQAEGLAKESQMLLKNIEAAKTQISSLSGDDLGGNQP